jgi:UDP-glucose 4-epimerase
VRKAPACTIATLAEALQEMAGTTVPVRIIGSRHGEKIYETLLSREEMAKAEDHGDFYRVPADEGDLNYDKYLVAGQIDLAAIQDYTSHNTTRLDVAGVCDLLRKAGMRTDAFVDEA